MIKEKIPAGSILQLIAAASVIRKEKLFYNLLSYAKNRKIPAGKIYEVILQSYLFAGFPSALISLKIFKEVFPLFNSKYKIFSYSELKKKGEITCKKIYGDKYEKLIENVRSFSPELSEWLVIEGYGKVLSRSQLNLQEREMAIIAMLSVLKFKDQLYSHINGAFRLGIKLSLITRMLESLNFLGNKSFSAFGIGFLNAYLKNKKDVF
jgi:4-carboxymuconolactone decarboxylase